MTGDTADIASRIRSVLPTRWFPDTAPVLDALLTGLASVWAGLYSLLAEIRAQSRLMTASGSILDTIATDFFGPRLPRRAAEPDEQYRPRIIAALAREHATRKALQAALTALTGRPPIIFEPSRAADTGCYAGPAIGYGIAGAWGNLSLPFQLFITVHRPPPLGIATIAGYGTPGPLARASLAQTGVQLTDTDIHTAITSVMPTASIAWTRITN